MIFYGKFIDLTFKPDNQKDWLDFAEKNDKKKLVLDIKRETGVRTPTQNNSLHLGYDMIAKTLNDAGLDMKKVLKPEIDIPWTTESVKEYLWRPVQKMMTGKKSSTELNKVNEITDIWDTLMRHLGEKHHVEYIPFPSKQKEEFDTAGLHKGLEVPDGQPNFDIQ